MEELRMRSKAIKVFDFREIELDGIVPPFSVDEEQLENEMALMRKRHAVTTEENEIARDDIVTLECRSEARKFNRQGVTVRVGRGLYSRELEEAVIGMERGEERDLMVDGCAVAVRVVSISRRTMPELTDKCVAEWGLPGVDSVSALRQTLIERQRESYISETAEGMAGEVQRMVNERSVFELDEGELAESEAEGRGFLKQLLLANGINMDTASDEEVKAATGMSIAEHSEFVGGMFHETFLSYLVGTELLKRDGVTFTEADRRAAIEEQAELMGIDSREAAEKLTWRAFVKQKTVDHYFEMIEEYIKEYLSERK